MFSTTGRYNTNQNSMNEADLRETTQEFIISSNEILPFNSDKYVYSIDRVENLINQKSNILHNHIDQTIKPLSIETNEIIIENMDVKSKILTNESNISNNSSNISNNSNDISNNSSNISNNSNDISNNSSNISNNSNDISNNSNDISNNSSNISTNSNDISTNSSNITTNSDDITALQNIDTSGTSNAIIDLQSNITALETIDNGLRVDIDTVATQQMLEFDKIDLNTTKINANNSFMLNNSSNISINANNIINSGNKIETLELVMSTFSNDISTNSNNISNNSSNISTNSSNISNNSNEISTFSNDISTNSNNISNNSSNISTNSSNISNNSNEISNNLNNINSIGSTVTSFSENLYNNSNAISNNSNDISTNSNDISNNSNDISTNSNDISNNSSNISTNSSNISTYSSDIINLQNNISTNSNNIIDLQNNNFGSIYRTQLFHCTNVTTVYKHTDRVQYAEPLTYNVMVYAIIETDCTIEGVVVDADDVQAGGTATYGIEVTKWNSKAQELSAHFTTAFYSATGTLYSYLKGAIGYFDNAISFSEGDYVKFRLKATGSILQGCECILYGFGRTVPPLYIPNPSPINANIGNNQIDLSAILNITIDPHMIIKAVFRTQSNSVTISKTIASGGNSASFYYVKDDVIYENAEPSYARLKICWSLFYPGFLNAICPTYYVYNNVSGQSGTDWFDITICKNAIRTIVTIPINWSN